MSGGPGVSKWYLLWRRLRDRLVGGLPRGRIPGDAALLSGAVTAREPISVEVIASDVIRRNESLSGCLRKARVFFPTAS